VSNNDFIKRRLPKDELREDAVGVFRNSDRPAELQDLTSPEVSVAAFKAVFFDDPLVQSASISFS
jgi:hypothetical protein